MEPSNSLIPVVDHTENEPKYFNEIALTSDGTMRIHTNNIARTSNLLAPIMLLSAHHREIFTARFHPQGKTLVSAGSERLLLLWNVYDECENYAIYHGHKGAITEVAFASNGERMASCSTDKTVAIWDYECGAKLRSFKGHHSYINSCCYFSRGNDLVVSGSDDNTLRVWDYREKNAVKVLPNNFPVTADFLMLSNVLSCCFDSFGNQVVSGGIDNDIKIWDIRNEQVSLRLRGHCDTITGVKLSPDGAYLLSNSMDNTLRMWDIYPYTNNAERCLKVFVGHSHNFEQNLLRCAFSPDSKYISCGSADTFVNVWECVTGHLVYKLPGHRGSVNDVDFHPHEPIILSAGSDTQIYLGELQN